MKSSSRTALAEWGTSWFKIRPNLSGSPTVFISRGRRLDAEFIDNTFPPQCRQAAMPYGFQPIPYPRHSSRRKAAETFENRRTAQSSPGQRLKRSNGLNDRVVVISTNRPFPVNVIGVGQLAEHLCVEVAHDFIFGKVAGYDGPALESCLRQAFDEFPPGQRLPWTIIRGKPDQLLFPVSL